MSFDGHVGAIGSDMKLVDSSPDDEIYFVENAPLGADLLFNKKTGDLELASGEMNLAQAILHRIRTAKGELEELGHPEYGSTILDFVGLPNNWATRERLKLAVRDAIRQESRVKEIKSITVRPMIEIINDDSQPQSGSRVQLGASSDILNSVHMEVVVIPVDSTRQIGISFPFSLEGV
jgi:phage baseplate assembly protein W